MKIGFDLDGTLDRPVIAELCIEMLNKGHEVYIISGVFPDAAGWQDAAAKRQKLARLGIPAVEFGELDLIRPFDAQAGVAALCVLNALPTTFDRHYRLVDLGLRKGALCEKYGITLFVEDSTLYAEMIPKMSGNTTVLLIPTYKS